jgi:hypothetical protein
MDPLIATITGDPVFFLQRRNFIADMAIFVSVYNFGAVWAIEVIFVLEFPAELLWVAAVWVCTCILFLFALGNRVFVSIRLTPEVALREFAQGLVGVAVTLEVRHVVDVSRG